MTASAIRWTERFAAIAELNLDDDFATAGLCGFAYPEDGGRPCQVVLSVDGDIQATAIAGGYSTAASAAGVRFGWCGFELGTTCGEACTDVEIKCGVSNRVLLRLEPGQLQRLQAKTASRLLTVVELTARASALRNCTDLKQIYPFANDFRSRFGERRFVTASYRYLLGRPPGASELNDFLAALPSGRPVEDVFHSFTSSEEFRRVGGLPLPGVFTPGFHFGTALFGGSAH